jgi:hypothetical protein
VLAALAALAAPLSERPEEAPAAELKKVPPRRFMVEGRGRGVCVGERRALINLCAP